LRAFVDAYATTGKPSFSVTAHGELQLDWPGCERMSVIEQVLAIMAAIQPEQVLGWLETEAAAQLQLPDGQDNVSVATLK
jgi:hypothetical protein